MCINEIKVENIRVSYAEKDGRRVVLSELTFRLPQGETLAILGPSGCGKSTLISALTGELVPDAGQLIFVKNGRELPHSAESCRISIIPQSSGLLPWKTVRENCQLPFLLRREQVTAQKQEELKELLELLGINHLEHQYPSFLSGGEQRRGAIACAFLQNPELLLMDEPFSALDAINTENAWQVFFRVWERYRPATILVTHSIEEALYLGSRVAVMGVEAGCLGSKLIYMKQNPFFAQKEPDLEAYAKEKSLLRSLL